MLRPLLALDDEQKAEWVPPAAGWTRTAEGREGSVRWASTLLGGSTHSASASAGGDSDSDLRV